MNGSAGDQSVTSANVSTDEIVAIEIFGKDIQNANGLKVRFEYDARQVTYDSFAAGNVLPSAQALPARGTGYVEIGIASLGGQATANSGLVGTVRFRTTGAFSGTEIRLVRAELDRSGQMESMTLNVRIELKRQALTPDFNGDGKVDFADFLAFARPYGSRRGDGRYEAKYDLDSDGAIGFGDFLIVSRWYGKDVTKNGGSGTGSPDLIVDTPSVSNSTLTAGQSFTLQATVRNQGRGQSASTTLRYYRSVNATISESDMQVGTDAVGSLTASGTSSESISLNAPSSAGTYYYGACVWSVSGESDTGNNCSRSVRVTVSSGGSTANVAIPDANLRAVIETKLGKASGAPITTAEMATLTGLDARDSNISDLTGLEHATGLTGLLLSNNSISDVSALSNLTNLTRLSLDDNSISDVSALSNLTNLTRLSLDDNSISDVSALSNLTNLTDLYLTSNSISDVSALSNLTNLTVLRLYQNSISDISALSNLTNLTYLWLDWNSISDVSALSNLTNLTVLRLYQNSISDVSALSNLTNLTDLNLSSNSISDISALSNLTNLTYLGLNYNRISDISALSNLTNLTRLRFFNNRISDIAPLSSLTNLTSLWLDGNSLSDVSALSNLTNLTVLFLGGTSISNIAPLSNLTNLTWLRLSSNSISDLSPLVANTGLGSGDRVDVRNNPLSATSRNTHIPALQARGVEVQFGAGKPAVETIEQGRIPEDWEGSDHIFR